MRDDRERLLDILEAIGNIERYAAKGQDTFLREELVQIWIIHHIQVIGEAAANLSLSVRERHPDTSWVDVISMRNLLVHQYFGIDLNEIWDTVAIDLPKLKREIEAMLKELEG